jgi:hypothetical protein
MRNEEAARSFEDEFKNNHFSRDRDGVIRE